MHPCVSGCVCRIVRTSFRLRGNVDICSYIFVESSRRTDRERDSDRDREGQDKRRHCLQRAVYIREMMELPSMPPYAASKLWPAVSGFQVDDKFIFLVVISEL